MKRDYVTGTTDGITYFTGIEIEKSPAEGMKTLFVVGLQDPKEILSIVNESLAYVNEDRRVKHVYFGANQSFQPKIADDWRAWEDMIDEILDAGLWATLDLDLKYAEELLEGRLNEKRRFITMISIKLPYLAQYNYNTTIKIDDKGFDDTNPGVWCHKLHNLISDKTFTTWDEYGKDEIIK